MREPPSFPIIIAILVIAGAIGLILWRKKTVRAKQAVSAAREKTEYPIVHAQWVEHYKNSPHVQEILAVIYIHSTGSHHKPEEIRVSYDQVCGITHGVAKTYDFPAHRMESLPHYTSYSDASALWKYVHHRQALAEAINYYLSEEYTIDPEQDAVVMKRILRYSL